MHRTSQRACSTVETREFRVLGFRFVLCGVVCLVCDFCVCMGCWTFCACFAGGRLSSRIKCARELRRASAPTLTRSPPWLSPTRVTWARRLPRQRRRACPGGTALQLQLGVREYAGGSHARAHRFGFRDSNCPEVLLRNPTQLVALAEYHQHSCAVRRLALVPVPVPVPVWSWPTASSAPRCWHQHNPSSPSAGARA